MKKVPEIEITKKGTALKLHAFDRFADISAALAAHGGIDERAIVNLVVAGSTIDSSRF